MKESDMKKAMWYFYVKRDDGEIVERYPDGIDTAEIMKAASADPDSRIVGTQASRKAFDQIDAEEADEDVAEIGDDETFLRLFAVFDDRSSFRIEVKGASTQVGFAPALNDETIHELVETLAMTEIMLMLKGSASAYSKMDLGTGFSVPSPEPTNENEEVRHD